MLCRVEMPSNEQIFGRFYRYRLIKSSGGGARAGVVMLPVLAAALLIITLEFGVPPVVAFVPAVLLAGWLGYTLWVKPGRLFRAKAGAALQTEVTIFTETGYTHSVKSEEGGAPENTFGNYGALVLAVETGRDFYLFTSPAQALTVDKEYFTNGGPETLRAILQTAMGKKFKGRRG